jgi:hypothetical protein
MHGLHCAVPLTIGAKSVRKGPSDGKFLSYFPYLEENKILPLPLVVNEPSTLRPQLNNRGSSNQRVVRKSRFHEPGLYRLIFRIFSP